MKLNIKTCIIWCYQDTDATTLSIFTRYSVINSNTKNSVIVGNGSSITSHFHSINLHNILVTPKIIKTLSSVCHFTKENAYFVEFDPFEFSVKDLLTWTTMLRSNICEGSSLSLAASLQ